MRVGLRWLAAMGALCVLVPLAAPPTSAEEARAAVPPHAAEPPGVPNPDAFLGALSFGSSQEPIAVSADTLTFDYRTRVLIYKGGVVVTQGDMKLETQTLTVGLDDRAQNRVKEVVADGQVRLSQGARLATGGRAVFDQTQHTVVLSENAELHDGPNQVSGDRVVVYLDQSRSVVEGGNGRVKAVLFPPKSETTPAAGGEEREAQR